jgi:iron complex outermembrane receptor protein
VPDFSDLVQQNLANTTFVPLQAQRAWTVEAGTRGRIDRLTFDVTLYRAEIRDELINFATNAGLGIPAATFNAPRTRHQGVEVAFSLDLARDLTGAGDTLTLTQVWTRNDFRFVGDPVYGDNRIAGLPRDILRTVLTYANGPYTLAPTLDWVPRGAFADHANTLRAPGYALLGLQASASIEPGLTLFLDARNLTNARYVSDVSAVTNAALLSGSAARIFYPGDGRSVFAGLRATF